MGSSKQKPEIIKVFDNLLWAHLPGNLFIKTSIFRNIAYICVMMSGKKKLVSNRTIRIDLIEKMSEDLHGFASDIVDEILSSRMDGQK